MVPGGNLGFDVYLPEGNSRDDTLRAQNYLVDYDFIKTYGMKLIQGRDFSREFTTDSGQAVIINEKASKILGWGEKNLGKKIFNVARNNRSGVIVGVIKDFHGDNMKIEIPPVVLSLETRFFANISVRIHSQRTPETLANLEKILKNVV